MLRECFFFAKFAKRLRPTAGNLQHITTKMIQDILIIRFRRVGDSVLSMALCHSLKLSFPHARIHFVINKAIAPLFQSHPDVDRLVPFNERECHGLLYVKKVRALMRQTRFDVVIDMRSTPKTLLFALFSLSTPYRIGRMKWYNKRIHNYRLQTPAGMDRVQSNLHLMEPLKAEGKLIHDEHFPLYITEKEKTDYANYMTAQGVDLAKPVVLVAVATRIEHKAWPKDRMRDILRQMLDNYDVQLVFNYGNDDEKAVANNYYDLLEHDPRIFINIEAKGLRELCALCACSSFFFGNEGGPRHISQAFEIPSFAIYPPGIDKDFWLPGQSERYQGISPDDSLPADKQTEMSYKERMELITVEDVWTGLSPMLDQYVGRPDF